MRKIRAPKARSKILVFLTKKINILADFLSKFTTLRALPIPFRACPTPAYRSPALLPPDPCVPLRSNAAYPRGTVPPCHSMVPYLKLNDEQFVVNLEKLVKFTYLKKLKTLINLSPLTRVFCGFETHSEESLLPPPPSFQGEDIKTAINPALETLKTLEPFMQQATVPDKQTSHSISSHL